MRLALISGVLALITTPVFAQISVTPAQQASAKRTATRTKPVQIRIAEARKALALDLLKQSHALNEQLDDDEQLNLLYHQAKDVVLASKSLGRQWAHELFNLASQTDTPFGRDAQLQAIQVLSFANSDEALALLEQIDPKILAATPDESLEEFFSLSEAEHQVFLQMLKRKNSETIPKILHAASTLGEKGRYPYWAVMSTVISVHEPEKMESIAKILYTRFQQRIDEPFAVFEFAFMLRLAEPHWPPSLMKPALEAIMDILPNYKVDEDGRRLGIVFTTPDGSTSTARGPVEMELLRMAPLMKRHHPELMERLTRIYPILTEPVATVSTERKSQFSIEPPKNANLLHKPKPIFYLRRQIEDDPSKAEETISSVSSPELRAEALVYAANRFAATDPERAARFASEAEKTAALLENSLPKLRALCARIGSDVASAKTSEIDSQLAQAFQMADKLMRKAVEDDDGDSAFEVQQSLIVAISATAKQEPDLTVAHINSVYLPHLRSQLLISAAEALFPPPPF